MRMLSVTVIFGGGTLVKTREKLKETYRGNKHALRRLKDAPSPLKSYDGSNERK